MMLLTAAQHVSGFLTSGQSARRQAGFQTICLSKDLIAAAEVRILESQVQSTLAEKKPKWQSYRLSPRRHVICRVLPIDAPDDFGRHGRFFAHSLVFDVADAEFDDFIFSLTDEKYFFNSLEALLASEAAKSGYLGTQQVRANTLWVNHANRLAETWSGVELDRLFVLMAHTPQISQQGQSVHIAGQEEGLLNSLKLGFMVAPAEARHLLSFDTNAERDLRSPIKFWGRGAPAPTPGPYLIDADQRTVTSPLPLFSFESFSLSKLSPAFQQAVGDNLRTIPGQLAGRDLFNRSYPEFLGHEVYKSLCLRPDLVITESDVKCLTSLRNVHLKLNLLLALLSGDHQLKFALLRQLDSDSYRDFLNDMSKSGRFPPVDLFTSRFISIWFETWRGSLSIDDVWVGLERIESYGSKDDRREFELVVKHLTQPQLVLIEARAQQSKLPFKELQKVIKKLKASSEQNGSLSKPGAWFRRLTGRK